jgi:hypothetical protein
MRRISWIDQRISGGVVMFWLLPGGGVSFFWAVADWRDVGSLPSWRRRASPGHVTVPAMPGSALVVIEPELVFRGFEAVLDRPSMAFDRDQRFN